MGIPQATVGQTAGVAVEIDDRLEIFIWGEKISKWKLILASVLCLMSFGLFALVLYWKPKWLVRFVCSHCSLEVADVILIRDDTFNWSARRVHTALPDTGFSYLRSGSVTPEVFNQMRYFTFKKQKFLWLPKSDNFVCLTGLDQITMINLHNHQGWSKEQVDMLAQTYGPNVIDVKLKSVLGLTIQEAFNPFYMFQLFSVIIWFSDTYYYYASIIVVISVVSIAVDVYQVRKNQLALHNTLHKPDMSTVIRGGQEMLIQSNELVPGDLIVLPSKGGVMTCDAVLVKGNCILNESSLTGESVPVTKVPLPYDSWKVNNVPYDVRLHAKHTLFCGTEVLQTRYYSGILVQAVVTRTGFNTQKGLLVRSIMYPKPVDFEFTKDLLIFIGILSALASVGMLYTAVLMGIRGNYIGKIFIRALDLITICVPPALPAAMTIGVIAAESRLKKKEIYCISPNTVNLCGGINVVCFDKTGTLTEDGLDFLGVLPACRGLFADNTQSLADLDPLHPITLCMATCHSVTCIDNRLIGDPLDLIMFKQTAWTLLEPPGINEASRFDTLVPNIVQSPNGVTELGIMKIFPFASDIQRISVLVKEVGSARRTLYCKGAPETIVALCKSNTVPDDCEEVLSEYTKKGFRVLALACRQLGKNFVKLHNVTREMVEDRLLFLGLLVFENRLKPESQPVISVLKKAHVRTIMLTGDNILTATCVARECGILDNDLPLYYVECVESDGRMTCCLRADENGAHVYQSSPFTVETNKMKTLFLPIEAHTLKPMYQLAVTGKTLEAMFHYFPQLIPKLVSVCNVFARMSPDQKTQVVHSLQDLNYMVAMCGDGANDCGALKAAHAGISLSEAEASIASPFTSKRANIKCVIEVIRQGRAALTTSFGVFKYMAGYSLTQFLSVSLLYWLGTNMADFQFLYIDLVLITLFSIFFGRTDAAQTLYAKPPAVRIVSIASVLSLLLQLLWMITFQVIAFLYITIQPWFVPHHYSLMGEVYPSHQASVVFLISIFQYISLVVVYSKSHPYRREIWHNKLLFASIVVTSSLCTLVVLCPPEFLVQLLSLSMPTEFGFRVQIVMLAAINFLLCLLTEHLIIDFLIPLLKRRIRGDEENKLRYHQELSQIADGVEWLESSTPVKLQSKLYVSNGDHPTEGNSACQMAKTNKLDDEVILNHLDYIVFLFE